MSEEIKSEESQIIERSTIRERLKERNMNDLFATMGEEDMLELLETDKRGFVRELKRKGGAQSQIDLQQEMKFEALATSGKKMKAELAEVREELKPLKEERAKRKTIYWVVGVIWAVLTFLTPIALPWITKAGDTAWKSKVCKQVIECEKEIERVVRKVRSK